MQQKRLPIGYYLKLADNCLTKGIDEIQSQHCLNRIEWQILNSINEKSEILKNEILELMEPLADNQSVETILKKFIDKGQAEIKNNALILTSQGKDLYYSCFDTQQEFRKKSSYRYFRNRLSNHNFNTTKNNSQHIIEHRQTNHNET